MQRPYKDQIMTPFQLYEWASKNIPSVTFMYYTTEEYEREKSLLEDHFQKSQYESRNKNSPCFYPENNRNNDNQEIFTPDYFQRGESNERMW